MRSPRRRRDEALCDAAAIGDLAAVDTLLAAGVDPDSADSDGATALILAASSGQLQAASRLLAAGADPDEQEASGLTALMSVVRTCGALDLARFYGLVDIVERLEAAKDGALDRPG